MGALVPYSRKGADVLLLAQPMKFLDAKDLAAEMDLHPRTLRKWWRRLKVPPTIPAHADNKWSRADAEELKRRWKKCWQKKKRALWKIGGVIVFQSGLAWT